MLYCFNTPNVSVKYKSVVLVKAVAGSFNTPNVSVKLEQIAEEGYLGNVSILQMYRLNQLMIRPPP